MITITRTCDRCKTILTEDIQLWKVGIATACHPYTLGSGSIGAYVEWCRPCVQHFGLVPTPKNEPQPELPPTLSERLEAIIQEIVQQAIEP